MSRNKNALAMLVSLLISFATAARADDACQLHLIAGVQMHSRADGTFDVPIGIQGRNFRFLLATDSRSSIYAGLADELHMDMQVEFMQRVAKIEAFSIGQLTIKDFWLYRNPTQISDADGVLTLDDVLFSYRRGISYDYDFDFAQGRFNLFSNQHCLGKVVYWTKDPVAIVPIMRGYSDIAVRVDGKKMEALIATGIPFSFMSMSAASRYLGISATDDRLVPATQSMEGGAIKGYMFPFKTLDFEGVSISTPNILILPDKDSRLLGKDLVLGMNVLRWLHMYVATREGRVYFTAATAH